MTRIELTDQELVLLDGRVGEKAQAVINEAKHRMALASEMPPEIAKLVAEVVREASEQGALAFRRKQIRLCEVCKRSTGYAPYRSGRNKGRPNYNKPLYFAGVDLSARNVSVRGYATIGCCAECWDKARAHVAKALEGVRAEMPEELTGQAQAFTKATNAECSACGWKGHELEMGRLMNLFGDGYYRGKCPSCGAENRPLGPAVIKRDYSAFTIVPNHGDEAG